MTFVVTFQRFFHRGSNVGQFYNTEEEGGFKSYWLLRTACASVFARELALGCLLLHLSFFYFYLSPNNRSLNL